MSTGSGEHRLFTYGTLQLRAVQLDTFGRELPSEPDVLPGFRMEYAEIDVPRVVEVSGSAVHPILRRTDHPLDKVVGRVLTVSDDELDAADEYEASIYHRVLVTLASGRDAWVYTG